MLARVLARRWPAYALKHPQLFSQHSIATLRTSGFEVIETVDTTNYFPLALTVFGMPSGRSSAAPLVGIKLGTVARKPR